MLCRLNRSAPGPAASCVHNATGASEDQDDDVLRAVQPRAPALRVGLRVLSVGCPCIPREGASSQWLQHAHPFLKTVLIDSHNYHASR